MRSGAALALLLVLGCATSGDAQAQYYGREIGALSQLQHGVRGRVFAVDSRTIFLKDFSYDGEGPTAYFYVGASKSPGAAGATRLRDERGGTGPLRRYRGEGITLSLPDGKTLRDIKWLSIWCDEYAVNFGDVTIPRELQYPKPAKVGALRGVHGVSSDAVVVVDAQTLLVPNFSYDGEAPDAKFWVGRGDKPSPQGIRIADENGKEAPLRKYDHKTIVLTLPGELTVFDIGHFAVWCEAFTVNFGHVPLPRAALANVPPSLKMLGVSPQSRNSGLVGTPRPPAPPRPAPARGRVDATTYRPALRPGAAPLAALFEQPEHPGLHRRADDRHLAPAPALAPASQQLIPDGASVKIQPSKEIHYHKEDVSSEKQNDAHEKRAEEDQQQLSYQREQNANEKRPGEEPQYQQLYYHQQQHPQQLYYQQYQQQGQQQQQPEQQIFYRQPQSQREVYERELYLQQQRAYEEELLNQRYRQIHPQEEPLQYRLLPYQSRSYRRADGEASGTVTLT